MRAWRWRCPPPGCASPSARSTRRPRCSRWRSTPGLPIALSSDAHVPEQLGFRYERRASTALTDAGVTEICVFEGRTRRMEPLGLMVRTGLGVDTPRVRAGAAADPRRRRGAARRGPRRPLRRRRPHPRGDRRAARRRGPRRHRRALPRHGGAVEGRRLARRCCATWWGRSGRRAGRSATSTPPSCSSGRSSRRTARRSGRRSRRRSGCPRTPSTSRRRPASGWASSGAARAPRRSRWRRSSRCRSGAARVASRPMDAIDKDRMLGFRGEDLADSAGDKIGKIVEMYLDAESGEPEWALVHTGLFGSKQTFVPLRGRDGGGRRPARPARRRAGQGCAAHGAQRPAHEGPGVRALPPLRGRARRPPSRSPRRTTPAI